MLKKLYKITILFLSFIVYSLLIITSSFAEGTKQIKPTVNDSGRIEIMNSFSPFALYDCPPEYRLYISICNPGEIIYYGFGRIFDYYQYQQFDVVYRIKDPNGNIVVPETPIPTSGNGFISTYNQAIIGPDTIFNGGYPALSFTATTPGDYYIEFNYDFLSNYYARREFEFFDITVASPSNQPIDGRVWSKAWQITVCCSNGPGCSGPISQAYENTFNGKFYIYTDDGIVTSIDFNGMQPFVFTLSANETGCTNTGNLVEDRKSRYDPYISYIHPQYKIFLNNPDTTCFPSGFFGSFTEQTTITGCPPDDYCINVTVNKAGTVQLVINLNGIPGYQAGSEDLYLVTQVDSGYNCIPWDGLNGLGQLVPSGTTVSVDVTYWNGITHMPLNDVEYNKNGFKVTTIRPYILDSIPPLYWDDSDSTLMGSLVGTLEMTGCTDTSGCHKWDCDSTTHNCQSDTVYTIGEKRTINTWWYTANNITDSTIHFFEYISVDANINTPGTGSLNDTIICLPADSSIQLNGAITVATGCIWSGGQGTFSNDTILNPIYHFSQDEINTGYTILYLTTTGNGFCPPMVDSIKINIVVPPTIILDGTTILCPGDTSGTITATIIGNANSYIYHWNTNPQQDSLTATGLTSGTYIFHVTDVYGACSIQDTFTISAYPAPLIINSSSMLTCNSICNSIATIDVSGGTPPYSYEWNTIPQQTTQTATDLCAGIYSVTVTDSNGCFDTTSVHVPAIIPNANFSFSDTTCENEIIYFFDSSNVNIGNIIEWYWDFGDGDTSSLQNPSHLYDTSGIYNVSLIITSNDLCKDTLIKEIHVYSNPKILINDIKHVSCHGMCNGEINVSGFGAISPYNYLWDDVNNQNSAIATGLCAGVYHVTVTDSLGCNSIDTIEITEPSELNVTYSSTKTLCQGASNGSATVSVIGGIPPYNFEWIDFPDVDTNYISGVAAGTYQLIITDFMGCEETINILVDDSNYVPPLVVTADVTHLHCGESTYLYATSDTGYSYLWSPSENINNVAISNPIVNPYETTTYIVMITDTNGCKNSDSITIYVEPSECGEPYIYVPNAFTPNGDNQNDILYIRGSYIIDEVIYFAIYDRWGEKVFETKDINQGWDGSYKGKPLNSAVFVYHLKVRCKSNEFFEKKGNITLLR